jgi:hypothetical protein
MEEYNEIVDEICGKYGYSEDVKNAISITLPLMVKHYGEDEKQEIIDTFYKTKIYASKSMDKETIKIIEKENMQDLNSHIIDLDDSNPYDNDSDPGSVFFSVPIYDRDMNVEGEKSWLIVKDMQDSDNGNKYMEKFGTYINIPYFIHEMGHAYGMNKPKYEKQGNIGTCKKGMYVTKDEYIKRGDKYEVKRLSSQGIIIEEMINENDTKEMLADFLNVDKEEVTNELKKIEPIQIAYPSILINIADKFEKVVGKENLIKWRVHNDEKIQSEFNETSKNSDICKKYLSSKDPYEIFNEKTFELFKLKLNSHKIPIEEYTKKTQEAMVDSFAVLCGYQESKGNTDMTEEKFTSIRNNILGVQEETKKPKKTQKQEFIVSLKGKVNDNLEYCKKDKKATTRDDIELR